MRYLSAIDRMDGQPRRRALIIPVFIPHAGCPHRCAFCDQTAITGARHRPTAMTVHDTVRTWLAHTRDKDRPRQIAFYGGNFLGMPEETRITLLEAASAHVTKDDGSGIRFSTRPDTITADRMAVLARYPIQIVEVGVQSLDDAVLSASLRGHDAKTAVTAVRRLAAAGYRVGVQLMVGLPGDSPATALATARQVADLSPAAVRIYPTIVLRHSRLAEWMARGDYRPWGLDVAVSSVAGMARIFAARSIPVIRMGLQADDGLQGADAIVAGPYHPAFGHLVQSRLFYDALNREMLSRQPLPPRVTIGVNPRSRSRAGGWRNATIEALEKRFSVTLRITPDRRLNETQLRVGHHPPVSVFGG